MAEDNTVFINSYISNLHPSVHTDLYHAIGDFFQECVPLLECSLTDLRQYPLAERHSDSPPSAYEAWCETEGDVEFDEWCENYVENYSSLVSREMGAYCHRVASCEAPRSYAEGDCEAGEHCTDAREA